MRTSRLFPLLCVASVFFAALLPGAPLPIVQAGHPAATIVVSRSAGPITRRAASLLADRIARKTGVQPAVASEAAANSPAIVFATGDPNLGEEGFEVRQEPNRLVIRAREGRGMLYGAGKILRTARYGPGMMMADPPLGVDKPLNPHRMLYLAIHVENYYEMHSASTIQKEIVEDMALWGANGVLVWFDISQYKDPFEKGGDSGTARARWNKEVEVLRLAQQLGLEPGYTLCTNEIFTNQLTPEIAATPAEPSVFQALACPSNPKGREVILKDKTNLARGLAKAGVSLKTLCYFSYDTGGCRCDRCRPWVKTSLEFSRDTTEVFAKYHPKVRTYIADWHFTDEEARTATDFFNTQKPSWLAGIYKDDRHPPDRFATLSPEYPVFTFLEITEIGAWGTVGANPFAGRLHTLYQGFRRAGLRGHMTYSEGMYDDFNKAAATRLAWNPDVTPAELGAEYANYFLAAEVAGDFQRLITGMEKSWTNPLGSWGQQTFIATPEAAAQVEKLALALAAKLPPATRRDWRWQVLERRAHIGAAMAELADRQGFRDRIVAMVRARTPRNDTRQVLQARRELVDRYIRMVNELRDKVYHEPFTRYPPMQAGDWFMRDRTRVNVGAWVQLLQDLSAVIDGVAKP